MWGDGIVLVSHGDGVRVTMRGSESWSFYPTPDYKFFLFLGWNFQLGLTFL